MFLENKPGRLANVLRVLAREKINVIALTIVDSHEHSVLRMIVNDVKRTVEVLKGLGISFTESDVLVVDLKNQPGGSSSSRSIPSIPSR